MASERKTTFFPQGSPRLFPLAARHPLCLLERRSPGALLLVWSKEMSLRIFSFTRFLRQSSTIAPSRRSLTATRRLGHVLPFALALVMAGCGSGSQSSTAPGGFKTPVPAGPYNTYVGTSPDDAGAGNSFGVWAATVDRTNSYFSDWDVTSGGSINKVVGTFATSGKFLSLTQTNGSSALSIPAGYAFEIPARVAILRPGDSTVPIVAMVPTGCQQISGSVQFNFVSLPTANVNNTPSWNPAAAEAYGSLSLATSGSAWNFSSYKVSTLSGAPASNSGAQLPPGSCGLVGAGDSIYLPVDPSTRLPQNIAIGPTGFYIADQGSFANAANPSQIGILQPSAQLTTSDVLSQNYVGFIFESGADSGSSFPESQIASFGASVPAGQLSGGAYANDDPTQAAASNFLINLGSQDATRNGLYPSVVITNLDFGTTYSGVAVVGNPESKYAIFIIAEDSDNGLPINFLLFQQ
jgi:hypothetical protein